MGSTPGEVIRDFIKVFNAADMDGALALIAPDAVDHAPIPGTAPGLEGWRQKWEIMHAGFPDATFTIEQSVEDGDTVATRYTMRGTHSGEFMGMPPTGKSFEVLSLDMIRVRDGRIVDHWGLMDMAAMMAQLGLMEAPSG